jgi:hypothetical protein
MSMRAHGENKTLYPEDGVRSGAWDKYVASSTEPMQEVGTVVQGNVDVAMYTLPDGSVVPLSAKRARFIQALTGADEVRGSDPAKGVAFYKGGSPVAVLMPLKAAPDIDLDIARKAAKSPKPEPVE